MGAFGFGQALVSRDACGFDEGVGGAGVIDPASEVGIEFVAGISACHVGERFDPAAARVAAYNDVVDAEVFDGI